MPMVRRNEPISTWEDGDFVQGFALVTRKELRLDRKGREYLDLDLADSRDSVNGKVWPDSPALKGDFNERDFVLFKGTARVFRDHLQLNVDHCRRARPDDEGFDEASLIPSSPVAVKR